MSHKNRFLPSIWFVRVLWTQKHVYLSKYNKYRWVCYLPKISGINELSCFVENVTHCIKYVLFFHRAENTNDEQNVSVWILLSLPCFQLMKWDGTRCGMANERYSKWKKTLYISNDAGNRFCLTTKTVEFKCNTWAIFNMYVFDHMSCNKIHQRSLVPRRNGITHEINN